MQHLEHHWRHCPHLTSQMSFAQPMVTSQVLLDLRIETGQVRKETTQQFNYSVINFLQKMETFEANFIMFVWTARYLLNFGCRTLASARSIIMELAAVNFWVVLMLRDRFYAHSRIHSVGRIRRSIQSYLFAKICLPDWDLKTHFEFRYLPPKIVHFRIQAGGTYLAGCHTDFWSKSSYLAPRNLRSYFGQQILDVCFDRFPCCQICCFFSPFLLLLQELWFYLHRLEQKMELQVVFRLSSIDWYCNRNLERDFSINSGPHLHSRH